MRSGRWLRARESRILMESIPQKDANRAAAPVVSHTVLHEAFLTPTYALTSRLFPVGPFLCKPLHRPCLIGDIFALGVPRTTISALLKSDFFFAGSAMDAANDSIEGADQFLFYFENFPKNYPLLTQFLTAQLRFLERVTCTCAVAVPVAESPKSKLSGEADGKYAKRPGPGSTARAVHATTIAGGESTQRYMWVLCTPQQPYKVKCARVGLHSRKAGSIAWCKSTNPARRRSNSGKATLPFHIVSVEAANSPLQNLSRPVVDRRESESPISACAISGLASRVASRKFLPKTTRTDLPAQ
ncbi:hypothetical protein B0H16DRAFT_1800509 [Mycena metata]|uniref:Uncharacterized protein n=1 Tax=Mycena metata TaxID=1033252 RepID=A0AAD7HC78_9AGAR|nr:hypothetical protein B0H16DRAFT_1800509 [Mycena metata]